MRPFVNEEHRMMARTLFRSGLGWEDVAVKLHVRPDLIRAYMRRLVSEGFFDKAGAAR